MINLYFKATSASKKTASKSYIFSTNASYKVCQENGKAKKLHLLNMKITNTLYKLEIVLKDRKGEK
ncbi:hypothetical protein CQ056_28020 [Peribacillus simplex]|nr:hypothetical protein CQ056_28020 [Peribacillus simplex]